jgi:hypothetical protein
MNAAVRLEAIALTDVPGPVSEAELPLKTLTVVLGPNDSGKSSILRAAASWLNAVQLPREDEWGEPIEQGAPASDFGDGAVFVRVRGASREALFAECLADLWGCDADLPQPTRVWKGRQLSPSLDGNRPLVDQWRDALAEAATEDEAERYALSHALGVSEVFVLRPMARNDQQFVVWQVFWCLPAESPALQLVEPASAVGSLDHVAVAPVGFSVQSIPPAALVLPTEPEVITGRVWAAAQILGKWLGADRPRLGPTDQAENDDDVVDVPKGVTDHDMLTAYELAATLAQQALPSWIGDMYQLTARQGPIADAEADDAWGWSIEATHRDTGDVFSLSQLASGHTLWIQLAILDAVAAVASISQRLWVTYLGAVTALLSADDADPMAGKWPFENADEIWAQYEARVAAVRELRPEIPNPVSQLDALQVFVTRGTSPPDEPVWADHDSLKGTLRVLASLASFAVLYVIDEPERHLHPQLQRRAASWLRDRTRVQGTQALIATHSPAFLSFDEDVEHISLSRAPARAARFLPADLAAVDELSIEIGLDRGELLTTVEVFLFVEGVADEMVLRQLFASELSRLRACVVPIHGASKHQGVIAAETLLRYTTSPSAILLDNVPQEITDQLLVDAAFREEVRTSSTRWAELKWLAEIIGTSARRGRLLRPLSIPVDDIFDLLDEDILRTIYPRFPGHSRARVDMALAESRQEKTLNAKVWREMTYGIPNTLEPFVRALPQMRSREVKPPPLVSVIEELGLIVLTKPGP